MNTPRLDVRRNAALPPLAWLLDLRGAPATLHCGARVACTDDAFFEGAWAGSRDTWRFDAATDVYGSGARWREDGWLLVPPSHTLECIYALRCADGWLASNSLPFLLARAPASLAGSPLQQSRAFARIVQGLSRSPVTLPTSAGTLHLLHHHNALAGRTLEPHPKPLPPAFADFAAYRAHLRSVVEAVRDNAAGYRLLATVSTGYDSPACATIARDAGCTEAFTFTQARGGDGDDGTPIGRALGLRVHPARRPNDLSGLAGLEAEFFATGMQGEDLLYAALAARLPGRILVTGFHGDKAWDLHGRPTREIKRGDISGASLGEFRLARDFIHLPLPFSGAQRLPELLAISRSEAMRPWSIGGRYDRPIPRRIAEEAGVPRALFGHGKKAVSVLAFADAGLLAPDTRRAILQAAPAPRPLDRLRYRIGHHVHHGGSRVAGYVPRPLRGLWFRAHAKVFEKTFGDPYEIFEHTNPLMGPALQWALSRVQCRYRPDHDQPPVRMP